jgi:hypothetical protein
MADRQTKIIGGNGTNELAFVLDPGLFQYVQSVLVEVDNGAGPDIRPTLSVQTVNGVPIADKQQGAAIPAGDTGRATWALRLTDEQQAGASFATDVIEFFNNGAGPDVPPNTSTDLAWVHDAGVSLVDLTNPLVPSIITAGVYSLITFVQFQDVETAALKSGAVSVSATTFNASATVTLGLNLFAGTAAIAFAFAAPAGLNLGANVAHNGAEFHHVPFTATLQKIF